jgi:16S rRNA (guanine527-N7)-methyltransferase
MNMNENPYYPLLKQGITDLNLNLSDNAINSLLLYLNLLIKWNKAFNLTAIRDPYEMVVKHLLDSLSAAPYFTDAGPILDVGTGAGLPGIPLAIVYPKVQVTLLDSNSKKTRFLNQVKMDLALHNVRVEHQRVELFQPEQLFSVITSRAFASLSDMVQGCEHLLAPQGRILAMKGKVLEPEMADIEHRAQCKALIPLQVPGDIGERHLIELIMH